MQRKETSADLVKDPSIYQDKKSNSSSSTSGGVTAFYTGDIEPDNEESVRHGAYIASSGYNCKGMPSTLDNSSKGLKSMPMSVKSTEDHLGMLASFVASYENYIQGKVHDPTIVEEDYDQIDPDDLEEIDLQWKLAMVARRAKRFMNRKGRKFVGGKVGFEKTKVKCYNVTTVRALDILLENVKDQKKLKIFLFPTRIMLIRIKVLLLHHLDIKLLETVLILEP